MRALFLLLAAGCAHYGSPPEPLGRASRPYTSLPWYLAHPISEHDLTAAERLNQMAETLRDIDVQATALPEGEEELKLQVKQLGSLVPPTPELLVPVERMKLVVDEIPRNSADATRRRLWALTDLIRLRSHF